MKISFNVPSLPPKKDGANSMWRKGSEFSRLKSLRIAAFLAMEGSSPITGEINLVLKLHTSPDRGDLDNFITGICDGLMAAHPRTPINLTLWEDVPEKVKPQHAICYVDDKQITRISAQRFSPVKGDEGYTIELEW